MQTLDRMVMRFGLRQPEQFEKVELAIEELKNRYVTIPKFILH